MTLLHLAGISCYFPNDVYLQSPVGDAKVEEGTAKVEEGTLWA